MNPQRRLWLGGVALAACPAVWAQSQDDARARLQARPTEPTPAPTPSTAPAVDATPSCPVPATTDPAQPWLADLCAPQVLGAGEFRWLGMRVYQAQLWAGQAWQQQLTTGTRPDWRTQDLALALTYQRRIRGQRLVDTSLDEIRRLAVVPLDEARLSRWAEIMASAWPNVGPGDVLGMRYHPGVGLTLYDTQGRATPVPDPEFGVAMMAIWLDARSRDTGLRTQLLGAAP